MTALQLLIQQLLGRQQSSSYGYPYSTVQSQYPAYPQQQYPQYPQYPQQYPAQYPQYPTQFSGSAYIPPIAPYYNPGYPVNPYSNYPTPTTTYPPVNCSTLASPAPAYNGSYVGQVVTTYPNGPYCAAQTYTWNGAAWVNGTVVSQIGSAYTAVGASPSPLYGSAAAAACESAGGTYYGSSGQCGYPSGHMATWNGSAFV